MTSLQTEFEAFKRRSRNWFIALGVVIVLIIVLLVTVFRKKDPIDQSYKLEIQRLQDKVTLLEQSNSLRDSIIKQHDQRLMENRKTETQIIYRYEKIPSVVRDLNREQLRNEVTNY